MPTYVEVAVNVPNIREVFHYHLPPELEGQVGAGQLVAVPFGAQTVQGVALRMIDKPAVAETKAVLGAIDSEVVLTPVQIALAEYLSESCLAGLGACASLMLPPGLAKSADVLYRRVDAPEAGLREPGPVAKRLLALLEKRGPLRGAQLDQALPRQNWRAAMRTLVRQQRVRGQPVLPPPRVQPKVVRTVELACPPEQVEAALPDLGRPGTQALKRRQAVLRFLLREPGPLNVSWVYAESGGNLADLRYLAERSLVRLGESESLRNPLEHMAFEPSTPPSLTRDQQQVFDEVAAALAQSARGEATPPILLHGVTGSGKTEIYLRAVAETIRSGRQAIILVPEIALTPQTVRRFVSRFPGQVGLLHSQLSEGERYDTWRRARSGALNVIVGPRSALFAPLPHLGLIVIDECHDDSYYQSDIEPRYHALAAARAYARLTQAVCLLGSATPDVATSYQAAQGMITRLRLPGRILAHREVVQVQLEQLREQLNQHHGAGSGRYQPLEETADSADLPPVQVVDMRQELHAGNRSIFSRSLHTALEQTLEQGEQAILFLNRRGTATFVFCRDCGHTLKCPRCDLPLTFHAPQTLLCHQCEYRRKLPQRCPECSSPRIRQYGTGTAKVETEVQALFPKARVLRWDAETTQQKGSHEIILGHFAARRADILVGTQMLAKGLDLPFVTLVGVVLADVGLNLPDYRASERTFQVLTQVAGRAGRSLLGGQVVLQTFQPEHYAIQAAAQHNYQAFYERELGYRRRLGYPPFTRLARLELRDKDSDEAERAARSLASRLREAIQRQSRRATYLIGPAPCFFPRLNGLYRWQIVLRGPDPASLLRDMDLPGWRIELNPPNLL
jgi:primosomal protein N' (replication factor Y) (superfamily II helicase)